MDFSLGSTIDGFKAAVNDFKVAKEKLRSEAQEKGQAEILAAMQEFFTTTPEIDSIEWVQYTPYFNDGDPCTFSVREVYFGQTNVEDDGEWFEENEKYISSWSVKGTPLEQKLRTVEKAIAGSEEAMEIIFGDHVHVRITAKDITIDSYNHD